MTVLFADLRGSTELLADRDPEEARSSWTRCWINIVAGTADASRPGCVALEGLGPVQVGADAGRRAGAGGIDVLVRPERQPLAGPGGDPPLANRLPMEIGVIVNYGDSVLVIGPAGGPRLRMRIAGSQPDAVRDGATVTVGWRPGDEHLIARE